MKLLQINNATQKEAQSKINNVRQKEAQSKINNVRQKEARSKINNVRQKEARSKINNVRQKEARCKINNVRQKEARSKINNVRQKEARSKINNVRQKEAQSKIDDSTAVSQSRHTLRFQPIACRSIMRCPRVLTRPEMVWQAFVPDIASGRLAVFDMAEKERKKEEKTQENGIVAMASVSQTNDRYPVKCAGVTF